MGRLESYLQDQDKLYKKLPKKVIETIDYSLRWRKSYFVTICSKCESPIEQILAVQLADLLEDLRSNVHVLGKESNVRFELQYEVKASESKYRLDFAFFIKTENEIFSFAIECDGHDYHEKTKEQARRDKKRDRDLMNEGYTVIRFTGSEIYENSAKCALEIETIIKKQTGIEAYWDEKFRRDMGSDHY